jgi:hypothetical protein
MPAASSSATPGANAPTSTPASAGPSACCAMGRSVPSTPLAASSSSAGRRVGRIAEYAGKKKASAAPSTNAMAASCHSCIVPVTASTPAVVADTTRTTSTPSRTARLGSRSAATPPTSTLTSRPTAEAVATIDSSVGPPPSAMTW